MLAFVLALRFLRLPLRLLRLFVNFFCLFLDLGRRQWLGVVTMEPISLLRSASS